MKDPGGLCGGYGLYDVGTYMFTESCVLSCPRFRAGFYLVRWDEGSTYVCRSRGLYLVVLLTTFNVYKFYTHNGDDIP